MKIAIDFDGTVVTHEFPKVGKDIGAVPVLKKLIDQKHQLILYTMRSNISNPKSNDYNIKSIGGNYLTDAVKWFNENSIPLYSIQKDLGQENWTKSPKCYAQLYIDDAALGCPLIFDKEISDRPFVDWEEVEKLLIKMNIL